MRKVPGPAFPTIYRSLTSALFQLLHSLRIVVIFELQKMFRKTCRDSLLCCPDGRYAGKETRHEKLVDFS